jgi:hypothetical protein
MPTVLHSGPYRLFFFGNEGWEPAHVHVQRDHAIAKFWLRPVALASYDGFRTHELRRIERLVIEHSSRLEEAWNEFFAPSR